MGRIKDYLMDWEETGEDPLNLIPEHIKAHPSFDDTYSSTNDRGKQCGCSVSKQDSRYRAVNKS
jgi:hypothetical protein